jgi:transmembrane sensor
MVATMPLIASPVRQVLPDGSIAELQDGARIAMDFSEKIRGVLLQYGAADFWVKKDPLRPFVVRSGGTEVRAVGTAFSVSRDNHKVGVVVTEGRVSVARSSPAESRGVVSMAEPIALLQPGRPVLLFDFADTPLAEAVALVNQHASVRLVIRDASLAKVRISITMLADGIDSMLRSLREGYRIEAERHGDEISLKKV